MQMGGEQKVHGLDIGWDADGGEMQTVPKGSEAYKLRTEMMAR